MLYRLIPLIVLLVSTMAAIDAAAQRPGVWSSTCSVDKMTDKRQCFVQIFILPTGRPSEELLSVTYNLTSKAFGVIGSRFGESARIRVDNNPAVPMSGCERTICPLLAGPSAALLKQVRGGQSLLVEMRTVQGRTIGPFETSLSGFDAAYREAGGQ